MRTAYEALPFEQIVLIDRAGAKPIGCFSNNLLVARQGLRDYWCCFGMNSTEVRFIYKCAKMPNIDNDLRA
jgi:hypothetical protein